ncbi:MAG: hypothetical protein ACRDYY_17025 [Acidimicrobiales bacterium]
MSASGVGNRSVADANHLLFGGDGGVVVARQLVALVDVVLHLVGDDLVVGAGSAEQLIEAPASAPLQSCFFSCSRRRSVIAVISRHDSSKGISGISPTLSACRHGSETREPWRCGTANPGAQLRA